jgi:Tfp pilus assembly protein PilF
MKKAEPRSKKSTTKRTAVRVAVAAPAPPAVVHNQPELFEKGIALFRQGRFAEALVLFEKAAEGPIIEVAAAARTHARMCEVRLNRAAPVVTTAEDHYNLGVALLNQRRLKEAEAHLEEALRMAPEGDHIHYALALSRGLSGDIQRASQNLRRAIELQPRNRGQARHDPDFAGFLHQPPIAALLFIRSEADS